MSHITFLEIARYILTVLIACGIMLLSTGIIILNLWFKDNRRK